MERPLRVLFFIDSLKMGGAERITVAMLPYFEKITPFVLTYHDDESPLIDMLGDIPYATIGARRLVQPGAWKRTFELIREFKVDLIHAQLQHATIISSVVNRRLGIPVVTTRHVMMDDTSDWNVSTIVHMERAAIRYGTQHLIYVSEASRQRHQEVVGLPRPETSVIYNGIELERFQTDVKRDELRARLNLAPDDFIVTLVGVIREGKGYEVTIEAARSLPDHQFLLVGDGDAEYAKQIRASAQGLPNVHFLGRRTDIPDILGASDLFVLPSDSEALPTVLIEAGAMSLPVIATQVGGIPEIIKDGQTGILIPVRRADILADTIRSLSANPLRLQQMGQAAREYVHQQFAIQRQVRDLTALYQQVVDQHASAKKPPVNAG